MKIASLTDPLTATGLKLTGLTDVYEVEDSADGRDVLDDLLGREDLGIIIITEELAQELDEKILEAREEKEQITPIIIEIPNREGPIPERREMIDKLVKRAVGIKVE